MGAVVGLASTARICALVVGEYCSFGDDARGLCPRAITHTEQQAIDADIFVQTLPMQSAAPSTDDVGLAWTCAPQVQGKTRRH